MNTPTMQQLANQFGVSVEAMRTQFVKQAEVLQKMADKAARTGKKVGGYTAETLQHMAATELARSRA